MIATHHIKVNGKWINPGEAYGEQKKVKEEPKPAVQEEKKAEPVATETKKPRTSTRRKANKE